MSIDWSQVIKDAENDLTRVLSARVVSGLIAQYAWLAGAATPLTLLVGLLIGQLIKYGDWLTYYLGDQWINSQDAIAYQQAGEALANLPPFATQEQIDAAEKAKADAFDTLMGAD